MGTSITTVRRDWMSALRSPPMALMTASTSAGLAAALNLTRMGTVAPGGWDGTAGVEGGTGALGSGVTGTGAAGAGAAEARGAPGTAGSAGAPCKAGTAGRAGTPWAEAVWGWTMAWGLASGARVAPVIARTEAVRSKRATRESEGWRRLPEGRGRAVLRGAIQRAHMKRVYHPHHTAPPTCHWSTQCGPAIGWPIAFLLQQETQKLQIRAARIQ